MTKIIVVLLIALAGIACREAAAPVASPQNTPITQTIKQPDSKNSKVDEDNGFKGKTTIVKFKPGRSSEEYRETVSIGTSNVYIINAQAGQTMIIDAKAIQETKKPLIPEVVSFTLIGPDKNNPFDVNSGGHWNGKLPSTGDYILDISGGPGSIEYILKIQIK